MFHCAIKFSQRTISQIYWTWHDLTSNYNENSCNLTWKNKFFQKYKVIWHIQKRIHLFAVSRCELHKDILSVTTGCKQMFGLVTDLLGFYSLQFTVHNMDIPFPVGSQTVPIPQPQQFLTNLPTTTYSRKLKSRLNLSTPLKKAVFSQQNSVNTFDL
jgi:hypothetical protein